MNGPVGIKGVGLVTSLGFSAVATCAALRAGVSNPALSDHVAADGEAVCVHRVPFERPWVDRARWIRMLASAVDECLESGSKGARPLPLLLCVPPLDRPGRPAGLGDGLVAELEKATGRTFDPQRVRVMSTDRSGSLGALLLADEWLGDPGIDEVLIAAVDDMTTPHTLLAMELADRLLTATQSNGFIAGEAAGAVLVGRPSGQPGELVCTGMGRGCEPAPRSRPQPLRALGLAEAMRGALRESHLDVHDLDFRIVDASGEQYAFKEAAIGLGRLVRRRMKLLELWHPAEGIGETGVVAPLAMIALAVESCRKQYAPGPRILMHASGEGADRCAAVFQYVAHDARHVQAGGPRVAS